MEKLTNRTQSGGVLRSLGKVLALMIFVVFLTFTFAGALKWFGINGGPLTKIIPFLAMLIGVLVFLKLIDRQSFSDIGLQHFRRVWDYSVIATGLSLLPLMWGVITSGSLQLTQPLHITVLVTLSYCLLIAFSEELLFRGYIYHVVSVDRLKLVVSAGAFAGFHFISPEFNVVLFLFYFLFGVIKVSIFKRVRSLWPLILFHLMWDMAATYTDYYSNPIICVVFLLVALAVLGLMARFKKCNEAKRGGDRGMNVKIIPIYRHLDAYVADVEKGEDTLRGTLGEICHRALLEGALSVRSI